MPSTLQFQLNPKRESIQTHIGSEPPVVNEDGNVDGDWDERQSNREGYVAYTHVPAGPAHVLIRAAGYADARFDVVMPHDDLVTVDLIKLPIKKLTWINRDLHRMMTEDGVPTFGKCATAFLLYKRFLDGEDIRPFLQQHSQLGFNMLRVMGMFESLGGFNPKAYPAYYDRIPEFLDVCNEYGLYVYWVCCAATGRWMNDDEAIEHIRRSTEMLQQRDNALASPVNEQWVHNNSIPLGRVNQAWFGWMLHDMGSYASDTPCERPYGTHCVLHTTRAYPGMVKDSNPIDNRNFIEGMDVFIDEPYRAGEDGSGGGNLYMAPSIAAEAAGCAWMALGWCFHSLQGQRGEVLHGTTLACAQRAIGAMGRF